MRALALVLLFMGFASASQAKPLLIDCQRYESKCVGVKCYTMADALKEDPKKEVLNLQKMEKVHYDINDTRATAWVDSGVSGVKYTPEFKYVKKDDDTVTLENKTETGAIKERVVIDKTSGFYTKYFLHTDGSIKDVPIGEPYNAFFGWCENRVSKQSEAAPIQPAAPATPQ